MIDTHAAKIPHSATPSAPKIATEPPEIGSLLSQLKVHAGLFFERAPANEQAGKLAPDVFDTLLTIGAIQAMLPRSLGGSEIGPMDKLRLIETLAEIDASTAWVTMATGFCSAAAAAYLSDASVQAMFSTGRGVVAGAGAPTGVARAVSGGFRVSGHWRYGSGILHAGWAQCGTLVEVDGKKLQTRSGAPVSRMCYVPIDQVQLGGNWDVIGLRATGSVDFKVDDVFVPEDFTCLASAPVHRRGDAIFGQGFTLATYIGHTGWAVGAARRLLGELAQYVRAQGPRPGAIGENQGFQETYARQEALLRAARALAHEAWQHAQDRVRAGESLNTHEITLIRLALVHVTEVARDIASFAYRIAGGETLRQGTLQRLCRDIQAGCQHMTSSPPVMQACGRVLAGLAQGEAWVVNGLVKPGGRLRAG